MSSPLLTVGCAVVDDFQGVYFSFQSLRLHNDLKDVELLVIDNKPDSPSSRHVRQFIEGNCQQGTAGARYVPMPSPTGTSSPRNRVFSEARGYAVLCMDSHVLVQPGALQRLIKYYEDTGSNDLLSGPLVYDNLHTISTHFNDEWRGGMWGTWGQAWQCICKRQRTVGTGELLPLNFSVVQSQQQDNPLACWKSIPDGTDVKECTRCGRGLPESIQYNGHEQRLRDLGYWPLGYREDEPSFEIPGQGLGLFSCRREAWLGFNEQFRGFGGEEMYIHNKFRKHGARALCLPFLRWVHRFYRPEGTRYTVDRRDMVRNYILGKLELEHSLHDVYNHFVLGGSVSQADWDQLLVETKETNHVSV